MLNNLNFIEKSSKNKGSKELNNETFIIRRIKKIMWFVLNLVDSKYIYILHTIPTNISRENTPMMNIPTVNLFL